MVQVSAGVLLWRRAPQPADGAIEVLIVHPGGPFWANKHEGAWSIPKGEFDPGSEDGEVAAAREFAEELGSELPPGPRIPLGETRLKSGKRIVAWAVEGELDANAIVSNTFELKWPPRSGRTIEVPEIDQARWVGPDEASLLLNPAQVVFVERLLHAVTATRPPDEPAPTDEIEAS
jgi:predicted NUDIX family NTP pyrophosphohydrolase